VGRGHRRLSEGLRDFCVRKTELDARDDRLAVRRLEPLKRRFVPGERFAANSFFNRRRAVRGTVAREHVGGTAVRTANLVADAVEQRGPQECLEGAIVSRLERFEALDHLRKGILDQVVGIERPARPRWQPAMRPFLHPRQIPGAQIIERIGVSRPGAGEQLHRSHRAGGGRGLRPANGL